TTVSTTTVKGERRVGERAGHASLLLGLLTLTFYRTQAGVFGLPRQTWLLAIAAVVLFLGFLSRTRGHRTGGTTGILLGLLILYFTFVAHHVTALADKLKIGQYGIVPYLLLIATVACVWYVLHQPKRVVSRKQTKTKTGKDGADET
ncbi:MAG: hypothetical protein OER86_07890, partial [Phycisphaerae bacterium]|nr:hypothetical protein [Phycisphaerae bacterium]